MLFSAGLRPKKALYPVNFDFLLSALKSTSPRFVVTTVKERELHGSNLRKAQILLFAMRRSGVRPPSAPPHPYRFTRSRPVAAT